MTTPVRLALLPTSNLQPRISDGLAALKSVDRKRIHDAIRARFIDSLDLDEGLRTGREQENRWDYLIGYGQPGIVIGLEPHSAKTDQISTVIAKRRAAIDQLRGHLKTGIFVAEWFWVASGGNEFVPYEKAIRQLDQAGITYVGRMLLEKHLPAPAGDRSKRR